jgi:hypothetical protein
MYMLPSKFQCLGDSLRLHAPDHAESTHPRTAMFVAAQFVFGFSGQLPHVEEGNEMPSGETLVW